MSRLDDGIAAFRQIEESAAAIRKELEAIAAEDLHEGAALIAVATELKPRYADVERGYRNLERWILAIHGDFARAQQRRGKKKPRRFGWS